MGRCMASLLRGSCDLTIASRDASKAHKMAGGLKIRDIASTDISSMDIVILAIPTDALLPFAGQISSQMRPGSLMVDVSSVKCGVVERICKALPETISYISIHPLFSSAGVKVKNTVVVPVRPGQWSNRLNSLLVDAGMNVNQASAEEHDRIMATVQVIHHFALLAIKNSMERRGHANRKAMAPFLTQNMLRTLHTLRMVDSNIVTVEMIQKTNKFSSAARKDFIEEAVKLDKRYSAQ